MFSLSILFSTFCLIFVSELPDKTSIATLLLATKYKVRDVILGAWLAFLAQTIVGVAVGSLLTLLPAEPIRIASGIGFLAFSILAFRQKDKRDEERNEEEQASAAFAIAHRSAWVVSFLMIFAAEWGDLTQVATAALVAQTGHPFAVGAGAILALWTVTVIIAYAGTLLGKFLNPRALNIASGILFAGIGLIMIGNAILS